MRRAVTAALIVIAFVALAAIGRQIYDSRASTTTTSRTSPTSSTSTSTSTTSTTTAMACAAADFTGQYEAGSGAAGTAFGSVQLTYSGSTACTITGWPGLTLYGAGGSPVSSSVTQSSTEFAAVGGVPTSPTTVDVAPNGLVQFELAFPDVSDTGSSCPSIPSLEVELPGSTALTSMITAGDGFAPCDGATVYVSPIYS